MAQGFILCAGSMSGTSSGNEPPNGSGSGSGSSLITTKLSF